MTNVYKRRRIDEPPKINVNLLNEEIFDRYEDNEENDVFSSSSDSSIDNVV